MVNHLLLLLSYLSSRELIPFAFPISFLLSCGVGIYLGRRLGLHGREIYLPVVYSLVIICFSLAFSSFFFDLSWDGEWYHQAAIYHLRTDWNPLIQPIRTFDGHNDASILHFPKSTWYYAVSVYSTFGNFEAGKSLNIVMLSVTGLVAYAVARAYNMSALKAGTIATILVLNPVIWSEITTYLVDGVLILGLTLYVLCLFAAFRKPHTWNVSIGMMGVVLVINAKFTGLVFLAVFAAFAFLYHLVWKRKVILRYILFHTLAFVTGLMIFGFNPYVTNTLERGHPLYPLMGTAKYPGAFANGSDDNELYETPKNLQGKHILTRLFYAHFGRPGNAPYNNEQDAELIFPFTSGIKDWTAYHYHETRVAGFGPYFSGVLVIAFCLLVWLFLTVGNARKALFFSLVAITTTLLLSRHFWWPRFAPQLWLLPVLPIAVCFVYSRHRAAVLGWVLAALMIINGLIVLFVHLRWETRASLKLYKQLSDLRQQNIPVEVSFGFFEKATSEKLKRWDVEYKAVPLDSIISGPHTELMSVVEGYPGAVLFRTTSKRN